MRAPHSLPLSVEISSSSRLAMLSAVVVKLRLSGPALARSNQVSTQDVEPLSQLETHAALVPRSSLVMRPPSLGIIFEHDLCLTAG